MPDSSPPLTAIYVLWLLAISIGQVYTYIRRPGVDAARALADAQTAWQRERLELHHRVHTLELQLEHVPTSVELTQLSGTVATLSTRIEGLESGLSQTLSAVQRIETYLLNRPG